MSTDRLNRWDADGHPPAIVEAVRRLLAGTPIGEIAASYEISPEELAAAVELYHQAGRRELEEQTLNSWRQFSVEFSDWAEAERTAVRDLRPVLRRLEAGNQLVGWWFIRKHPCWRIRLEGHGPDLAARFRDELDCLVASGTIRSWRPARYEAETAAFGGGPVIDIAHDLFCADSRNILDHAEQEGQALGRRELSLLLCTALMHSAGLEWYERGDVWDLVARERPLPHDVPQERLELLRRDLTELLRADATPEGPLFGQHGPLRPARAWVDVFHRAGHALGVAASHGTLRRGLRRVLAYHVIFHWNRLGLGFRHQATLAHAARSAILDAPLPSPGD